MAGPSAQLKLGGGSVSTCLPHPAPHPPTLLQITLLLLPPQPQTSSASPSSCCCCCCCCRPVATGRHTMLTHPPGQVQKRYRRAPWIAGAHPLQWEPSEPMTERTGWRWYQAPGQLLLLLLLVSEQVAVCAALCSSMVPAVGCALLMTAVAAAPPGTGLPPTK